MSESDPTSGGEASALKSSNLQLQNVALTIDSRNNLCPGKVHQSVQSDSGTQTDSKAPKSFVKSAAWLLRNLKWSNVIILILMHGLAFYGSYYCMMNPIKVFTVAFVTILGTFSGFGMSIGAHRLWAHRSFKARLPLKIFLIIFQSMTMNGSAFSYARDHRTHHKYSDTDADPKNPSRGLFYSHIGWWCLKKTQKVKDHGARLSFDDLKNDWVVWTQHRFYPLFFVLFGLVIPIAIPVYLWNEAPIVSFFFNILRIVTVLHHLFTVNSIAHFFGHRPYDFRIRPTENRLVIYLSLGEGNHNYHHTFPFDYSSSEKAAWEFFNPATLLIDIWAFMGLAYDLKKASPAVIQGTIQRKGIPAEFDPPAAMWIRILSGMFDWFCGIMVTLWPLGPLYAFKFFAHLPIFVF